MERGKHCSYVCSCMEKTDYYYNIDDKLCVSFVGHYKDGPREGGWSPSCMEKTKFTCPYSAENTFALLCVSAYVRFVVLCVCLCVLLGNYYIHS